MNPAEAANVALSICEELAFTCAGIGPASPSKRGDEFRAWLEAGKHGSMDYLARNVEARLDPSHVLAGAKSTVMVADVYAARGSTDEEVAGQGKVARYARGRDYHEVMKKRLHELADRLRATFPGAEFRSFVDTAPIMEREHAAAAGLGWIGKHTLLINPRLGSYLLLGGVLTTLDLSPVAEEMPDHCGTCTRCIDACPTGAITPYSVDASRCIAYLTIERRGAIPGEFHGAIGGWVFGCDVCQEVCPHNSARTGPLPAIRDEYTPARQGFEVLEILRWKEVDRRRAFQASALKRATLEMMKRNAVIVAGNLFDEGREERLLAGLRRAAGDADETDLVRSTAGEVLGRIGEPGGAV